MVWLVSAMTQKRINRVYYADMQNGILIIGTLCVWNTDWTGQYSHCSGLISSTYFHLSTFRSSFHITSSRRMRIAIAKLVSKSYERVGRRTYKNVPVNYAIRFSGPVPPPPPGVSSMGCRSRPHLP